MGRFVKGDVVVVPYPFSDFSAVKRRPALVIAELTGDDVIRFYSHLWGKKEFEIRNRHHEARYGPQYPF